jgi:hypothetical protein
VSKGWTEAEARQRVSLRAFRARELRIPREETVVMDPLWKEWVIVTQHHDGRAQEIHRKPRRGLMLRDTYRKGR